MRVCARARKKNAERGERSAAEGTTGVAAAVSGEGGLTSERTVHLHTSVARLSMCAREGVMRGAFW